MHQEIDGIATVLVVYDLDEDPTADAVRSGMADWPKTELMKNSFGRGALGAIKTGLAAATTELVVVMMADLSDPPGVVNAMVLEADRGADVVSASRYICSPDSLRMTRPTPFASTGVRFSKRWRSRAAVVSRSALS
jgi:hypothetical protein